MDFGALACGYVPIDWDTFVMDNSGTAKQDVSRTYQGVDGYTPSATYMGTAGYCLELALRPGSQHSALETGHNLERAFAAARLRAGRLAEQLARTLGVCRHHRSVRRSPPDHRPRQTPSRPTRVAVRLEWRKGAQNRAEIASAAQNRGGSPPNAATTGLQTSQYALLLSREPGKSARYRKMQSCCDWFTDSGYSLTVLMRNVVTSPCRAAALSTAPSLIPHRDGNGITRAD